MSQHKIHSDILELIIKTDEHHYSLLDLMKKNLHIKEICNIKHKVKDGTK